ncbi:MAG: mRNA surveillance protein Pelota [Candidatus Bathyarchaeota archaeon B63]|nr:MAG: mRNA surveillance protein Pelota [Candidatus Bathyarchaeota archaeon B63]
MRILRDDVKHGAVTVIPEVLDDLWVLYNIIERGDKVHARTSREIRLGDRYDRPEKGKRVSVSLGLTVERVMWDRQMNRLRVHGVIYEAPEEVGAGSHHTFNIVLNRPLKIIKRRWMRHHLDRLRRAAERRVPPVMVVSIDDEGYCVGVLRGFGIDINVEERVTLPGKARSEDRRRVIQGLFKSAAEAIEEATRDVEMPIVILGLGYIKNGFLKYLEGKPEIKRRIIDVKGVNSTGRAAIYEALRSGVLSRALRHVRVAKEAEAVEELLRRLGRGRGDVAYGMEEVKKACSIGAIDKLLLTDSLLREALDEDRRSMEELIREVEEKRGEVIIVSVEHEAGVKLDSLGGVAALLRFRVA